MDRIKIIVEMEKVRAMSSAHYIILGKYSDKMPKELSQSIRKDAVALDNDYKKLELKLSKK
jgi:hypothetical protein